MENEQSADQSAHKTPRVVIITGAAGGIGRATVELFDESGWNVIGVDRADYGKRFP